MYRSFSALAALAMTAGTLAIAAPAQAAPAGETLTISLAGLDPADPADTGRIERRLRSAARGLCGSDMVQPLRLMERAVACEKAVMADARGNFQVAAAGQATAFRLTLRTR